MEKVQSEPSTLFVRVTFNPSHWAQMASRTQYPMLDASLVHTKYSRKTPPLPSHPRPSFNAQNLRLHLGGAGGSSHTAPTIPTSTPPCLYQPDVLCRVRVAGLLSLLCAHITPTATADAAAAATTCPMRNKAEVVVIRNPRSRRRGGHQSLRTKSLTNGSGLMKMKLAWV